MNKYIVTYGDTQIQKEILADFYTVDGERLLTFTKIINEENTTRYQALATFAPYEWVLVELVGSADG